MNQIEFIKQYMKCIQLKDIFEYKDKPILEVSSNTVKAYKNNNVIMAFDGGYNFKWFIFNGSIPCDNNIVTTSFYVLKDL